MRPTGGDKTHVYGVLDILVAEELDRGEGVKRLRR